MQCVFLQKVVFKDGIKTYLLFKMLVCKSSLDKYFTTFSVNHQKVVSIHVFDL